MIMFKFNQLIRIFNLKQFTLFLFIALFIISGAIDLLSIALIGPFIVLLIDKDNEQVGKFIEQYLNFENFSQADIMVFLISALVGVFILKCIISIFIRFWVVKFSLQCRAKLQSSLLDIYQSMEYENFNLRNDTDFIKNLYGSPPGSGLDSKILYESSTNGIEVYEIIIPNGIKNIRLPNRLTSFLFLSENLL